jgi:arylsulfatase A-like enzyme
MTAYRLLLTALCLALISHSAAADQKKPNFILCMADDQGYGDVGYNGHPVLKTPVLDEMAASGLRFDRFYAAHPVCSPTRGSVMTGRHPNRFACFSWGHTLRPEEITVAEALKSAGYTTGHFGKWHIGSCRADDPVSPGGSGFDEWVSSPNFYENNPLFSHNGKVIETEGESSEVTVQKALSFIKQASEVDKPFLAVIWFGNPHTPHEGIPELKIMYANATEKEQNYYAEITGIDRAMGILRRSLREMEIAENTLLWYTSDNGQQGRSPGLSGGLRGAKGSLWEGGVRVPTIIEWPAKVSQPRSTELPGVTSDIYPTLLDIAGVTMDDQPPLDGVSLKPLIEGEMTERPPIGFWVYQAQGIPARSSELLAAQRDEQAGKAPTTGPPERTEASRMQITFPQDDRPGHAALIDGDWKLHRIPVKNLEQFRYELYNLADDRAETTNVARQHADRVAKMRKQLDAWQGAVIDSLNGADY